ncbi:uncharacterized protein [Primulina huaijiensis]|uniref:uncharacterized protein n=1 Tax=Primulina huaijiensis TaxID=1492673 RepID=UPI003CC79694
MKANTAVSLTDSAMKPRDEWTTEDKIPMFPRKYFDNWKIRVQVHLAAQDDNMCKIKMSKTAKEIWEKLIQLCEGNEQTKENKLSVAVQKFDNIKMKAGESMLEYDERISGIINELNAQGNVYTNKEVALKVVRGLPKEWDVKTMAMRESKDLNKVELHDLFADQKAYEF